MKIVKAVLAFLLNLIPKTIPSWLVELVGGLVLATLVYLIFHAELGVALVLATGASCAYELWLDPQGWSLEDVEQREWGVIVGCLLWSLLK